MTRTASPPTSPARRFQALSRTADGRTLPPVARRFAPRRDDRLVGWLVTLGVTLVAGVLRLWDLDDPRTLQFDEVYYAKDGWALWEFGYARDWEERAVEAINDGRFSPDLVKDTPSMVVHPEVGKWLIGGGEQLFGLDSFGWRFPSAVIGTLMVLVMVRLARRLTGSTLLGGVAGLLLAVDGLHFVLSRLALLDVFVAFFLLSAISCLVADRDWGRARLARLAGPGTGAAPPVDPGGWGPVRGLLWRPWRLAAGVMFGLAVGSKWSALVPLAAFGVLVVLWDSGARRALGVRGALWRSAVVDGIPAFVSLVGVAFLVYVATWSGWLVHHDVYEQHLSDNNYGDYWGAYVDDPTSNAFESLLQGLRSLYHYHRDVWAFHSSGLDDATHVYGSKPSGWLVLNRPVGVAADLGIKPGQQGCDAPADSTCLRQVVLLGTPALWWSGVVANLYAAYAWVARRDWRYGLVLVGLLSAWLPFFRYDERPIFSFYAATIVPFTVLALTLVVGRLVGSAGASARRRLWGSVAAGSLVTLIVLNFAWFWPIYTHELITTPDWLERIWLERWI